MMLEEHRSDRSSVVSTDSSSSRTYIGRALLRPLCAPQEPAMNVAASKGFLWYGLRGRISIDDLLLN